MPSGPPKERITVPLRLYLFTLGFLGLVSIAFVIFAAMASDKPATALWPEPPELTATERVGTNVQYTYPTEVRLVILSSKEFYRERPSKVLAAAKPYANPCVIYLPAGMPIVYRAQDKWAEWLMVEDAHSVAHELLHCLRGLWHGQEK